MIAVERFRQQAGGFIQRKGIAQSAWLRVLCASAALLAAPLVLRLDGRAHSDWLQFLGRFHLLLLHLPITLILLLPVFEIAGTRRPALREAAGFVLRAALAVAFPTLALGYLLAYGAGDAGSTVTRHQWGAIALCILLMVASLARPAWAARRVRRVYPALLVATICTLIFTSHQGGSLTHGSDYLTRYMPATLRRILPGGSAVGAAPNSFYAQHVHAIFDARCVACHGASTTKGSLRLDSFPALIKGGAHGAVVVPGKPEASLLLSRVTLAPGDPHFMPAEGRTPLTPEEIATLRAWIRAGASPTDAAVPGISIPPASSDPPPQPVGDYSALMPDIDRMQQGLGAKLVPVSAKPSDGLILRTVDIAPAFGDAQLAQFQKFAPYIVEAELGRTAITDSAFDTLRAFTHLRALHLEGTSITGAGLGKLSGLEQLTYLNLSGTRVTAQSIAPLKNLPRLRHLYLFDTAAQPNTATARNTQ